MNKTLALVLTGVGGAVMSSFGMMLILFLLMPWFVALSVIFTLVASVGIIIAMHFIAKALDIRKPLLITCCFAPPLLIWSIAFLLNWYICPEITTLAAMLFILSCGGFTVGVLALTVLGTLAVFAVSRLKRQIRKA